MATTEKSPDPSPYRDRTRRVDERLTDLLSRMTLEEKAAQIACPFAQQTGIPDTDPPPAGLGGSAWTVSTSAEPPRDAARRMNKMQRGFVETTRFGIPVLVNDEALCGLKVRGATVFPDAIAQAATWDPDLITEMADSIGEDMSLIGVHQALSPLCDVAIDPRWGRITETYGEDPYLVGMMATAFVQGLQGPAFPHGVIATLKHFIAYSASEGGRNCHPAHVGPRVLREVYGLPFEMAIRLAGAGGVMCSYNQVDAMPVQASHELLTGLLRDEYGFDGIVIADLNSAAQLWTAHGVAVDAEQAIAKSISAGLDLDLSNESSMELIVAAVKNGQLTEDDVDRAAGRVLRTKLRLGMFDEPLVDEDAVPELLDTDARRALARRVAERSIVLLRNEPHDGAPLLPLGSDVRKVAVIGPNADRGLALLGNYSYPVLDTAVKRIITVVDATSHGSMEPRPRLTSDEVELLVESVPIVTVLEGIKARAASGADKVEVTYARGCPVELADTSGIAEAVETARAADLAVVVLGDQSGIFEGATVGEAIESTSCQLPGVQRQLVEAVVASGTPTVVVLVHGRPFVLDWMVEGPAAVPAIVSALFPGEEGGTAVASILFGDSAPGGKTPMSFPRDAGAAPAPYNRTFTRVMSTYYDGKADPVFPFGHGLSYAPFGYSDLSISETEVPTDGVVEISCTVTNLGDRAADEVVQLYTRDPVARSSRPRRELKGFRRISLAPGAAAVVTFEIAADRVALWDPTDGWVVEPGRIDVMIGSSSEDIRLQGEVTFTGDVRRVGNERVLVTPVEVTPVS